MALHPFIAAMVAKAAAAGRPAFSSGTPRQARELVASARAALGPAPSIGSIRDEAFPTRSGSRPVRVVRPHGLALGTLLYFHGGGWVCGELDDFDVLARTLCARTSSTVLLVDYRLAPEDPFPNGLEDAEDAILWAHAQRPSLGNPDGPLVVAGDSAGANLATIAARRLRGHVEVAAQILLYPVTDCDFDRPSYLEHSAGPVLTRADMIWFFGHYAAPARWQDPDIAALRARDLSKSPPAFILTAEYDVLRDEGEAYARALVEAGVPVQLTRYDGLTHGFVRLHNFVDVVDGALADIAKYIHRLQIDNEKSR
jgi:acetyl esterase